MIIENLKKNITKYISTAAVFSLYLQNLQCHLIMKIMNNG